MSNIQTELHAMIDHCLFGPDPWPDSSEFNLALSKRLRQLGLDEQVAGAPDGPTSTTALGKAHHLDLVMVFIGLWEIGEVPIILESFGIIDEYECTEIYDRFEAPQDIKPPLLSLARKAYFQFYCSSQTLN